MFNASYLLKSKGDFKYCYYNLYLECVHRTMKPILVKIYKWYTTVSSKWYKVQSIAPKGCFPLKM